MHVNSTIRGGRLLDGTGVPWRYADVATHGDDITAFMRQPWTMTCLAGDVGAFADIAMFDAAKLRDASTYPKPHALAEGMRFVFVNGQPALADGKVTAMRAGRVLSRLP